MSDIFPKWTNQLPWKVLVAVLLAGTGVTVGVTYYFTPKYTRVGYQPVQPVPFSHAVHADQLGLDCRYCHNGVEKSWYSNVPSASTCMNCHNQVLKEDAKFLMLADSVTNNQPVAWAQVHKVPDYVYFNHSVHVNRGISCVKCHGEVNRMDEVRHEKPLSMAFCLECHRNPEQQIRHLEDVYNLSKEIDPETQLEMGARLVHDWKVMPSQNCSTCHR
jgi:formate-dependent nitrite reductase cytochrome c552 subunit